MQKCACTKEGEISEIHTIVKRIDASWFGNGKEGYKTKIDKFQGSLNAWKWLAGSGIFTAIVSLIVSILLAL